MERVRLKHRGGFDVETRPDRIGQGNQQRATRILREAIILAAEQVGSDGKGTGGLVGYLSTLAQKFQPEFSILLGKVLPLQLSGPNDGPVKVELTAAEAEDRLRERGIPITGVFDGPAELLLPSQSTKTVHTNGFDEDEEIVKGNRRMH